MIGNDTAMAALGVVALGALAAAFTVLLRIARAPGGQATAAIAGGLIAGVLLGPSVLARVAPSAFESLILGGVAEMRAVEEVQQRQAADIAALRAIDVSPMATDEQRAAHEEELAPLLADLESARFFRWILWMVVGMGAFACWVLLTARAAHIAQANRLDDGRVAMVSSALAMLVTGVIAGGLVRWLIGVDWDEALAFGIACGVTIWVFDHRAFATQVLRDASAPAGWIAGGVLGLVAIGLLIDSFEAVEFAAVLTVLAMFIRSTQKRHRSIVRRRRQWRAAWTVFAPMLVAICASQLDFAALVRQPDFWIATAIAAVFCHDGRWLGAVMGHRMVGDEKDRAHVWERSGVVLDIGAGMMQCAVALLLIESLVVSDALVGALLVGALILEAAHPIRAPIARWMDQEMHRGDAESAE